MTQKEAIDELILDEVDYLVEEIANHEKFADENKESFRLRPMKKIKRD